jgi:hypothetical protein
LIDDIKLDKEDPYKDILSNKFDPMKSNHEATAEQNGQKKAVDDNFKAFDFISKQQARYLIELLKQPVFFNMIPQEAKTIVNVFI